jgi:hypothetical protein
MRHFYLKAITFPILFVAMVYVMVWFNFRKAPMPPEIAALFSDTQHQIDQAHALVQSSRFKEAIDLLQHLHPSDPHEAEIVERLRVVLADQMFQLAQDKFKQGNIDKAIEIGSAIPNDLSAGKQFQDVVRDWNRNQSVLDLAKKFQSQGKDNLAIALLAQLDPAIRDGDVAQQIQRQVHSAISAQPTSSTSNASVQVATVRPPAQSMPESYPEPEYTKPEYRDSHETAYSAPEPPQTQSSASWYSAPEPVRTADASLFEGSRSTKSYATKSSASKWSLPSESSEGPTHDFSGFSR